MIADSPNAAPTANAGDDQTVTEGDTVSLNGTLSSDPEDGNSLTYSWTHTSGPTVSLTGAATATPSFEAPNVGETRDIVITLTVTDSGSRIATDAVTIRVNDVDNTPPTADAGNNQNVTEGDTVMLTGAASDTDPEDTLAYQWTHNATFTITIQDSTALNATFTAPPVSADTPVLFTLNVTDGTAHTTDTATIVIADSPNAAPTANAGDDQTVTEGDTVSLNGTLSSDPEDGNSLTYSWTHTSGPTVSLTGAATATPSFEAPNVGETRDIVITLTVTDSGSRIATDAVTIRVNDVDNTPPTADAGNNQNVTEGDTVMLTGAASDTDPEDTLAYQWTHNATFTITIQDSTALNATFTAPPVSADTPVLFTLNVTDGTAHTTDTATIIIADTPNAAPTANAGDDQTVTEGDTVSLNGTLSSDPEDGNSLTYSWTHTSGPTVSLTGAATATPSFEAPNVGETRDIVITLTVTDSGSRIATDAVTIRVNDVDNTPPTADAGNNQNVTEGDTVMLTGAASDTDPEDTLAYQWTHNATFTITIQDSTALNATFTAPPVSADTPVLFTLNVTDGTAHTTDTATIVIADSPNAAPTANAGDDQTVTEGDTVSLNGTLSSDPEDGNSLTYSWTHTSGPTVSLTGAATATPSFEAPNVGETRDIVITLTVTDSGSRIATDAVTIRVNDVDNTPPTADAGNNQNVTEGDTVMLTGAASDTDPEDTLAYQWTHNATFTITIQDSTALNATFTAPPVSADTPVLFTLNVTDGTAHTTDTATIIIADSPIEVTIPGLPILEMMPVSRLVDDGTTRLGGATDPGVFTAGGHIYAAVPTYDDNALQVVNITDPSNPRPLGHLSDTRSTTLVNAWAAVPFESGGLPYAVVTSYGEHGIQVVNLTDPSSPAAAGRLTDTTGTALNQAQGADIFESGGLPYAVVASNGEHGIQVVNLTDPSSPAAAGRLTDTGSTTLRGAYGVAVFESGGLPYAVVAANSESGTQVVNITDPSSPAAAGRLTGSLYNGIYSVDTIKIGDSIYGVVGVSNSDSLAMIDLTDPANPRPAGSVGVSGDAFGLTAFESGGYHYALVGPGYGHTALDLVDISDPDNPVLVDTIINDATTALAAAGKAALFRAGDHLYAIVGSYQSDGIQVVRMLTTADLPPRVSSAAYNTGTGILNITFSEPLDGAAIHYDRIAVRDIARSTGGLSLDDVATRAVDPSSTTITLTLSASQRQTVNGMATPQLDIGAGAVSDIDGNGIWAAPNLPVTVTDATPPILLSASYNTDTGILSITFSEPLNHTATDYSGLAVIGQLANVTLDRVATKTAALSTIWATLDAAQMGTAGTAPTLAISVGAVSDPAGNGIAQTTGTIGVAMLGLPITEIRPIANITDSPTTDLDGPSQVDIFERDGRTYAAVASNTDDAVQIVNVTDPARPAPLGSVTNSAPGTELDGPFSVAVFERDGRTYAAVASASDDAVQIVDITDPSQPAPLGSVTNSALGTELDGPFSVAVFERDGRTYAAVASYFDDAVQIVNMTDPADPDPIAVVRDDAGTALNGARSIATFETDGRTYAAVASYFDNAVQIIDVTDPDNPAPAGRLTGFWRASSVDVVKTDGGRLHAVIGQSWRSGGSYYGAIGTVDISNPARPVSAGTLSLGLDGGVYHSLRAFMQNGYAYALVGADTGDKLSLFDITDPTDPSLVGSISHGEDGAILDGPRMMDVFWRDGRAYALVPSYYGDGIQVVSILTAADIPPAISSAAYITGTGILNITFSEPLDSAVTYSGMVLAGENGNVTLDNIPTKSHSDDTITATLNATQRTTVGDTITLSVSGGAVADQFGNGIAQTAVTVDVTDGILPALVSSRYTTGAGILNIIFSEPLGSAVTYSGMVLAGENGNVTLGDVSTKSHSDDTITATLNATQRTTVGGAITLSVSDGAITDIAGNGIAQTSVAVTVTGGFPPALASSSYNTGTGILNMTFSEPLNGTAIRYDLMHIRDAGQSSDGLSLDDITTRALGFNSTTITLTLSAAQRQTLNGMATPQLDIEAGAVSDIDGNGISAAPDLPVTIIDDTPPALLSASYNTDTGILSITFSEPLNHAATNYSGLAVTGQMASVTLDQVATKTAALSTIWATLNATQMETAGTAPTLAISEGAVTDIAGNGIAQTTGTIGVTMLGLPILEMAPVASLSDMGELELDGPFQVDVFERDGRTYAAVASFNDDGIQIVNMTDPANPDPIAVVRDDDSTELEGPFSVAAFERDGRTYAAVASFTDDGIQIVNMTDPADPDQIAVVRDDAGTVLDGAGGVAVFERGGRTYAAVASFYDDGIQIVDVTNPASPAPLGNVTNSAPGTLLDGARSVAVFETGGRTYAAVASSTDGALQIIDVTYPNNPAPTSKLAGFRGATSVDVVKTDGGRLHAVIGQSYYSGSHAYGAISTADISDPASPISAGTLSLGLGGNVFRSLHAFMQNGYAYALAGESDGDELSLFDITDPANPSPVDSISHGEDGAILDGPRMMDVFWRDGRIYAAVPSFTGDGIQVVRMLTSADFPPEVESAGYGALNNTLRITFDRDLNHAATDYSGILVRDIVGDGGGIRLSEARSVEAAGNTVTAVFGDTHGGTIGSTMIIPYLVVETGAVTGTYGNSIEGATLRIDVDRPFEMSYAAHLDFDFGRSTGPRDVGTWADGGRAYALALFTHNEVILNVTDPYNPAILHEGLLVDGEDISTRSMRMAEIDGRAHAWVYEIVGSGYQYHLFDLGEPAVPSHVHSINGTTFTDRLYTHGDNTYLVSFDIDYVSHRKYNATLQITNVTNPAAPVAAGSAGHIINFRLNPSGDMVIFGADDQKYLLLASVSADRAFAVNVTDPYSPAILSSIRLQNADNPVVYEFDGGAYAAILSSGDISVLNLTDPANLTLAGSTSIHAATDMDLFESGGRTYALLGNEPDEIIYRPPVVVDITNPANPIVVFWHGGYGSNLLTPHISHFEAAGRNYVVGATTHAVVNTPYPSVLVLSLGSSVADDVPPAPASGPRTGTTAC